MMGSMTATNKLIGDTRTRDVGVRQFGASLGSLAFQAGHLGAGLGWHGSHGWHGSTAADGSPTTGARSHLLEACS